MISCSGKRAALACIAGFCLAAAGAARIFSAPVDETVVFPYGKQILAVDSGGIKTAGTDWPGTKARSHDFSSSDGGFVAWDRDSGRLYRWTGKGLISLGVLSEGSVYLSGDWALGQSDLFTNGSGFSFSIYRLSFGIKKTASFKLDCFVSDAYFANRRFYIAGADRADKKNSLYEVDVETGRYRLLAALPKSRDFGRIVSDGETLWFFLSPSTPHKMEPAVISFALGPEGADKGQSLSLKGLDSSELSWYGFGFAWDGLFWLPAAGGSGAGTKVSLYAFEAHGDGRAKSRTVLPTGITKPVGRGAGGFVAIGYLNFKNSTGYSVLVLLPGKNGGLTVKEKPLPLRQ